MNDLLQADASARQRALDPDSFIVEAPAGAGKTELLTQRTLCLLARVDHPEEVVALTFTNKAAAEMRDRILGSLELAASGQRPGDDLPHKQLTYDLGRAALARDAELGWQLLAHPGRLAVTTLDALCNSLARQMPLLSRFGAQPGIAEDAAEHYRDAARRTLALLEEPGPAADIVAAALDRVDNHHGRLEKLLIAMLGRREQWLEHIGRADAELRAEAEAGLAALIRRDLDAAAAAIPGRWQTQIMAAARFAANTLLAEAPDTPLAPLADWNVPLSADLDQLPRWQALAELVLTAKGEPRKTLNKNNGLPATAEAKPYKEALTSACAELDSRQAAALHALRNQPPAHYDEDTWAAVENFSQLLKLAAAQLWLVFQEAGQVDFGEIGQRALLALGADEAPTDLALALDYRIRHLLVDEFQDTSPTQVRLIAGLTRGWQPGDGRTLFLVGDPMQSIYRFRKADVGLFLRVREHGIGNLHPEKLRLYRNNRSQPAIVDWVNAEFPAVFPSVDDPLAGAVSYAPSVASRSGHSGGVEIHSLINADADAEAAQMLAVIHRSRAQAPDGSIAVLVRARSHLAALVAAIRRSAPELRFQAVETEALAGKQAVQDVLALAHALLHRADRVHWLAILRAPWCGLTLADLHALAADDHRATVWSLLNQPERRARLSPDGQQRLAPLLATLGEALAHAGRQHPRRWIESVWRRLGGPLCLQTAGEAEAVDALFALIDQLVASGRFDADILASEAAALFAPPDPSPEAGCLQMMTIHKAKGLEFDTVLLPGLHRSSGKDDSPLLVWDEVPAGPHGEECLIAAPLPQRGAELSLSDEIYTALRRQERARSRHESERLLYVAATRARRQLHLFATLKRAENGLRAPGSDSLLALLWQGQTRLACEQAADTASPVPPAPAVADTFVPHLLRLPLAALPAVESPAAAQPATSETPAAATSTASIDTAVGTLTHRCLELIAGQDLTDWTPERLERLRPAYALWLRREGLPEHDADTASRRVLAALKATLASPQGRWLLDQHEQAATELALLRREEGEPTLHVLDRTFIADGERWIVDYKVVHDLPGESLKQRAEQYRAQLERYAALFAPQGTPLRTAIFFVAQGTLVELAAAAHGE